MDEKYPAPGFYWFKHKNYDVTKIGQVYYLDVEQKRPLVFMFGWTTCFSIDEVLKLHYELVEEVKPCSK